MKKKFKELIIWFVDDGICVAFKDDECEFESFSWKKIIQSDDYLDGPEIQQLEDVNSILEYQNLALNSLKSAMGHNSLLRKQAKLYARGKTDRFALQRIGKEIRQKNSIYLSRTKRKGII